MPKQRGFSGKESANCSRIILWHDLHFLSGMYNDRIKWRWNVYGAGALPLGTKKEGERDREYDCEAVCSAAV